MNETSLESLQDFFSSILTIQSRSSAKGNYGDLEDSLNIILLPQSFSPTLLPSFRGESSKDMVVALRDKKAVFITGTPIRDRWRNGASILVRTMAVLLGPGYMVRKTWVN